jgi:uncharacterized membrane protein
LWFLYAVLSSVFFGLTAFFMKASQMRNGSVAYLLLGLYVAGSAGFCINALWEGSMRWDSGTLWLWGIVIGIGSAWGNVLFMKALELGPASLTAPLMNINLLLVILMSTLYFRERLTAAEAAGIILLMTAIVFIAIRKKEPFTIKEKTWFLFVAMASLLFFLRNGGLKVTAELGLANTPILFFSYFLSAVWFAGDTILSRLQQPDQPRPKADPRITGLLWGLVSGFFSYLGLQLYSVALQTGPANIVAPIFSTYGLVTVIGSMLVYKEKLTSLQKAALILLFLGLILVKL